MTPVPVLSHMSSICPPLFLGRYCWSCSSAVPYLPGYLLYRILWLKFYMMMKCYLDSLLPPTAPPMLNVSLSYVRSTLSNHLPAKLYEWPVCEKWVNVPPLCSAGSCTTCFFLDVAPGVSALPLFAGACLIRILVLYIRLGGLLQRIDLNWRRFLVPLPGVRQRHMEHRQHVCCHTRPTSPSLPSAPCRGVACCWKG